jgi:hypothetical protein
VEPLPEPDAEPPLPNCPNGLARSGIFFILKLGYNKEKGGKMNKWLKVGIIILVVAVLGIGGYLIYRDFIAPSPSITSNLSPTPTETQATIPQIILNNKFGFLSGDEEFIKKSGAGWVRPHPGPFLWDAMQKAKSDAYSFKQTDELVQKYQNDNIAILATLWPFAEFDQSSRSDAPSCLVSDNDEFLAKNDEKGRGDYLPQNRCNPSDWDSYKKWVEAVVERYDGDGKNDMKDLKIPIKYWEVMNEPDLEGPNNQERSLDFYKQGANDYAQLLINTSVAIRSADSEAKILIAGAAGADDQFLAFYRQVFAQTEVSLAFDIGNVHCISDDQGTFDFNVGKYKAMLAEFGITKPIWVTEAETFYGTTAEENYQNTQKSTTGALSDGAQRIFYTRYNFDDTRKNMSEVNTPSQSSIEDSILKYQSIIKNAK